MYFSKIFLWLCFESKGYKKEPNYSRYNENDDYRCLDWKQCGQSDLKRPSNTVLFLILWHRDVAVN